MKSRRLILSLFSVRLAFVMLKRAVRHTHTPNTIQLPIVINVTRVHILIVVSNILFGEM